MIFYTVIRQIAPAVVHFQWQQAEHVYHILKETILGSSFCATLKQEAEHGFKTKETVLQL